MTTFDHTITCAMCDTVTDAATSARADAPRGPKDGDPFLCWSCGCWLIFDQHALGGCRRPGIDEIAMLENSVTARTMIEHWHNEHRKGPPS
jgi:hypothetical protein